MQDFDKQGGLAFLLVHLAEYYLNKEEKGRSSIPYSAFNKELMIPDTGNAYLNYLAVALKYGKMKKALAK